MAAEIIQISTENLTSQNYEVQDTNLIPTFEINTSLTSSSYIELFIYDNNQNILESDYNFSQYKVLNDGQSAGNNNVSQIEINPEDILFNYGYTQGEYITYFNFLNKKLGSYLQQLYITEISSDRTELRLNSTTLTAIDIVEQTNNFIQEREESSYFLDFYLNFEENQLVIANNIQLDDQDPLNPTVLIKLYEPLSVDFDLNSTLWVVTSIEEPTAYKISYLEEPIIINDTTPINGPNFNLNIKDQINNSTLELSYIDLISTSLTSSQNQLNSLFEEKEIDINIDFSNFSNFIHFSSAKTRLENFYYKLTLIEQYETLISSLTSVASSSLQTNNITVYESNINNIITNFDNYEYYLYYNSGSYAWPKLNTEPPYQLALTNDPIALTWLGSDNINSPYYGGLILSASLFDNNNKDNLLYTIPEYLRDDPANQQYELFVEMVGQFYDNIWVYYKDVTEKYNADNRLDYGISKDIVADAIREFGIKLYQNNFSNEDLYTAFLGLTPEGSLFPFPNITGSLPTPSGFEYIDTLISASNDYMPLDDVNKSLYKRIYHNLPYLLKSKGTLPGLRALITSYGIPDTILRINEYGGKDKINSNDWDFWQDTFNYAFTTPANNFISTNWDVNPSWGTLEGVPDSISFRFKTTGLPKNNIPGSQSLWNLDNDRAFLTLKYTGSGYVSGSYLGSSIDPYYQYANLELYPGYNISPNISASIYFPFFDGEWWSIMINRVPSTSSGFSDFTLYAGNKIYEGGDNGTLLGFYSSSTVTVDHMDWITFGTSFFALGGHTINGDLYDYFSGSLQEIRYFKSPLSESVFKDYIMNPYSIEGNTINSSPDELMFRASLGGELYTGSNSIHPKVTGSWTPVNSFNLNSDFNFLQTPTFIPNTEYFFYDQPVVGIKNAISDKIRLEDNVLPEGDTLSPFRTISQQTNISQSYTANTNLLEVAFSPQDEINDDIVSQIGYFNIGEYIGDPRERFTPDQSYPALNRFRDEYFQKYIKNYDLVDFIRLIKFFDNSLFKMIKDFVPARTSLASGIVIKQHILERNKYPQPKVDNHTTIAHYKSNPYNTPIIVQDISVSGTIAPQWNNYQPGTIENFSGGTGGTFEQFNGVNTSPYGPNGTGPENIYFITQSWIENVPTISGSVVVIHEAQDEFYDGEFSGSNLIVTTQSLFAPYPPILESSPYKYTQYYSTSSTEESIFENNFLDPNTSPSNGEILLFHSQINGVTPPLFETKYLKVAKLDCNGDDQSFPLGQATTIKLYIPAANYYASYNLSTVTEYSNYYFYIANSTEFFTGSLWPDQILNYSVTSSITTPRTLPSINSQIINSWLIESGDAPDYFNTSSGIYTLGNTPNLKLTISASVDTFGSLPSGSIGKINLVLLRNGLETVLSTQTYNLNGLDTTSLATSIYPIQQDQIYVKITKGQFTAGNLILNKAEFSITQSVFPIASNCYPVIIEPYLTTPNYYNSDYNPLLNNVDESRLNTLYQDIDYYPGIVIPTNFDLLISGSALRAAIPDSNYTTKRHIIPRYNGSKSTSQLLNTWSPPNTIVGYEDIGTYGQIPTVESLKTIIAYADGIGGWPPERMNASGISVKYLIKANGDIIIPNTTENSLADIQNTFITNERLIIESNDVQYGEVVQYRNIIRGGSRIEPILYNQIGQIPGGYFTSSIDLTDNGITGSVVNNFQAKLKLGSSPTSSHTLTNAGSYNELPFRFILTQGASATFTPVIIPPLASPSYRYRVNSNIITEGTGLSLVLYLKFKDNNPQYGQTSKVNFKIVRLRNGVKTVLQSTSNWLVIGFISGQGANLNIVDTNAATISTSIPFNNLQVNDEYLIEAEWNGVGSVSMEAASSFRINQTVAPNSSIPTNGLWISSSGTITSELNISGFSGSNIIYTTASALVTYYDNSYIFQKDISSSGFNPIALPWSIKYGDEFRFEGWENRVFQVAKADIINNPNIPGSPVLAVELNQPVPSSSIMNINKFLIRRYVNDASQIIMEGYRPINSQGPYLIRPEYVVPELDKSIGDIILDLTQKGLI